MKKIQLLIAAPKNEILKYKFMKIYKVYVYEKSVKPLMKKPKI